MCLERNSPTTRNQWLVGRLVGRLVAWLVGCLVGWLAGCLVGGLVGGLVGWLVGWHHATTIENVLFFQECDTEVCLQTLSMATGPQSIA